MDQRFGNDWRDRDWEHPQQDVDADWWVVEHRLWGGRARLVSCELCEAFKRSEHQLLTHHLDKAWA